MNDVTLKSISDEFHITTDFLIQKLSEIGINKTGVDLLNNKEKEILLSYINRSHNILPNKLILQRKIRSTLHISSAGGKNKLVQIEIRKKHTYMRNDPNSVEQIGMKIKKLISQKSIEEISLNENVENTKHIDSIKKDCQITKKTNDISYQNDCLINFQEHSEIISSKKIKKSEYVTTVETLKRKKERISNKVKEKTQKMIEKSKYTFIEKDKNYLSNINSDTLNILDKKKILIIILLLLITLMKEKIEMTKK